MKTLEALERLRVWAGEATRPGGHFERTGLTYRGLFKAPLGLCSLGLPAPAARAACRLQQRFMREDGDFADPPGTPADPHGAPSLEYFYTYRPSWILLGAQRLGLYELARPVARLLADLQDSSTGGFRAHPQSDYCHVCGTAQTAVAMLAAGRLDLAAGAADFLTAAVERQPRSDRIGYVFDASMRVVEDWPADPNGRWLERGRRGQCSYMAALPAGLLAQMYLLTGRSEHLAAAKRYYDFVCEAADDVFSNPAAGKLAWSSALLHRITDEPRYRENAWRAAESLIRTIEGPPVMHVKDFYPDFDRQPPPFTYEVAFELAYWLTELVKVLPE